MGEESFELRRGEEGYPQRLEDLSDPPECLYGIGAAGVLEDMAIAIVGSRRASPYGVATAEMAGRIAAESGLVVVSGGALGCDAAALRAAQGSGGTTVVVCGCGADVIYPQSSRDVFEGAISKGAVISLERWGTPPRRYAFPKRNRIIAAMSESTLVVEAGVRSGTMSTAEAAPLWEGDCMRYRDQSTRRSLLGRTSSSRMARASCALNETSRCASRWITTN